MQDNFTDTCESSAYNLLSSGEYAALSVGWVAAIRHLRRIFSNSFLRSCGN